ncbi:polysaccharide deacetylase family protein [Natronococcus roseus]|uniref:polysaccharide deacetylase family protein n=1 Tax=Natronococcus roseus TaxID=1052014 RepID=UPI00374D7A0B
MSVLESLLSDRRRPATSDVDAASATESSVTNVLSFDLEHWYTATLLRDEVRAPTGRLEESVRLVCELLDARDVRATFFVVGQVAAEYPELVRALAEDGHEIATHGHTHTPLFELTPGEFEAELADSADAIGEATGTRPIGFRAPNFSITPKTRWAFDVLSESDLQYDSSVFPVRTPMYGVSSAPVRPYRVAVDDPFSVTATGTDLLEFPLATFHPTLRIPTAGGFYARLQPTWLLRRGIRNLNRRGIPATLYFHPWEFNPAVETIEPPGHKRLVSFHGIDTLAGKLDSLLALFEFDTLEQRLDDYDGRSTSRERRNRTSG